MVDIGPIRSKRVNWSRLILSMKPGDFFVIGYADCRPSKLARIISWHEHRWSKEMRFEPDDEKQETRVTYVKDWNH